MPAKNFPPEFKPHNKGLRKIFGETETEIMELLWTMERVTVRDIYEVINQRRGIAYTTILTIMNRLKKKKLLRAESTGKTYFYTPVLSREQLIAQMTHKVIDSLIDEFPEPVSDYLLEQIKKRKISDNPSN